MLTVFLRILVSVLVTYLWTGLWCYTSPIYYKLDFEGYTLKSSIKEVNGVFKYRDAYFLITIVLFPIMILALPLVAYVSKYRIYFLWHEKRNLDNAVKGLIEEMNLD